MDRWENPAWVKQMSIRLDYSGMMEEYIGARRGISRQEIETLASRAADIAKDIEQRKRDGKLGFYRLPYDMVTASDIVQMAKGLRKDCDDLIVLGIGGSALGGIALFHSLCHPLHNLLSKRKRHDIPRAFFLDNVDPSVLSAVLDNIMLEKTVFNVVTKSGTTTETLSQFFIVRELLERKLGESMAKDHIVVTTDNTTNPLRKIAETAGYQILDIPENVGGRFSVFSPVGLFPAALLGIDIQELVSGAWYMDQRCQTVDLMRNPAYLSGLLHYMADVKKGLHTVVMMPYSDALSSVAFWFRQLWAESLGKARDLSGEEVHTGQTPVAALGVTDQHSQLQLYLEGPYDKMIDLVFVERHENDKINVPADIEKEFKHLSKHKMGEIFNIEAQSTQMALTRAGRSNLSIILPEINPFTIGQLLFLLEVQTLFAGGLYKINPLDQPGVQAIKDYVYGALGRDGYQTQNKEFKEWPGTKTAYSV